MQSLTAFCSSSVLRGDAILNCDRVGQWQPQLQTLTLTRIASLKYGLHLLGFQLPKAVRVYQREYDLRSPQMLEAMADAIEDKSPKVKLTPDVVFSAFLGASAAGVSTPESRRFAGSPRRLIRYFVPRNRLYSRTQGLSGKGNVDRTEPTDESTSQALAEHERCALRLKRSLDEPLSEG